MKKRFGEILIAQGLISPDQLNAALALQKRRSMRLGAALVSLGYINEDQLVGALAVVLNLPTVDLSRVAIDPEAMRKVNLRFAVEHEVIPYAVRKNHPRDIMTVAMADPLDVRVIDELSFLCDAQIEPRLARASDIKNALRNHFNAQREGPRRSEAPIRVDSGASGEMTLVRYGGGEEVVDTSTGHRRPSSSPQGTIPPPPHGAAPHGLPAYGGHPNEATGGQVYLPPGFEGRRSDIDGSYTPYGVLLDSGGGTVDAEAFYRLERKFWALMRLLARRGLLKQEEFLRELGEP